MLALKADNPIKVYREFKYNQKVNDNGDRIDDLPHKDWLRAT